MWGDSGGGGGDVVQMVSSLNPLLSEGYEQYHPAGGGREESNQRVKVGEIGARGQ